MVRLDEIAAETQPAVATGVDFKPAQNRVAVRHDNRALRNRRRLFEFQRDDFAISGIAERVRFAQSDFFRLRINFDDEPFENAFAKHAVPFAPVTLVTGRQRAHTMRRIRRARQIELDPLEHVRPFLTGNADDGDTPHPLQFQ